MVITIPSHTAYRIESLRELINEEQEKGLLSPITFKLKASSKNPDGDTIGEFTFAPLAGNCGVVVSTQTVVYYQHRGSGHSNVMQHFKNKAAAELGYSSMLCTVECTNIKEIASLLKVDWKCVDQFKNKRSGHEIFTFTKRVVSGALW